MKSAMGDAGVRALLPATMPVALARAAATGRYPI